MSVVLSEKSDIQRQIDDIDRLKTFMKYQQMTLKPVRDK